VSAPYQRNACISPTIPLPIWQVSDETRALAKAARQQRPGADECSSRKAQVRAIRWLRYRRSCNRPCAGLYAENGAPRGRTTCGLGFLTQLAVGLRRIANIGAPHSGQ
jgi:hypothetical protein